MVLSRLPEIRTGFWREERSAGVRGHGVATELVDKAERGQGETGCRTVEGGASGRSCGRCRPCGSVDMSRSDPESDAGVEDAHSSSAMKDLKLCACPT